MFHIIFRVIKLHENVSIKHKINKITHKEKQIMRFITATRKVFLLTFVKILMTYDKIALNRLFVMQQYISFHFYVACITK